MWLMPLNNSFGVSFSESYQTVVINVVNKIKFPKKKIQSNPAGTPRKGKKTKNWMN